VGVSAVGWVDLTCGILLACNLFDETPVMRFIPLPATRARITYYEDGDPCYNAAEHICDVVCSGGLIRFVETDFDGGTNGIGWRATTWSMKLDWDDWRRRCAVDVDDVSVSWSCSALWPELLDLKKLDFSFPTLSVRNDNRLYVMAKVKEMRRGGSSSSTCDALWWRRSCRFRPNRPARCTVLAPSQATTRLMILSRQMMMLQYQIDSQKTSSQRRWNHLA
jgi:hypothetical protein